MSKPSEFWFPAKRVGWGWGLPIRWEGWLVLVGYVALILCGVYAGGRSRNLLVLLGSIATATVAFVSVVIHKGESPR